MGLEYILTVKRWFPPLAALPFFENDDAIAKMHHAATSLIAAQATDWRH